ncbi:MAG: hypothetical protein GY778_28725 [bacterium]|nr:hypothetical protein [bacterium]
MTAATIRDGSLWIGGLAACLTAAGCSGAASKGREIRLVASARPYELDLPIPVGFKLEDSASEDHSTGVARLYLRHLYVGGADKYAVRNFYREQMPLSRWSKVSDQNIRGVCTLRFEKGSESCTVEIRESGRGLATRTQVQVLVAQEQRGSGPGGMSAPGKRPT